MPFCRAQLWSACAGMHGSASPPTHLPHLLGWFTTTSRTRIRPVGRKGGETVLWPQRRGNKEKQG